MSLVHPLSNIENMPAGMSSAFSSHNKGLSMSGAFKPQITRLGQKTPAKTFKSGAPASARKALGDLSNRRAFGDITNKKGGLHSKTPKASKTGGVSASSKKTHAHTHKRARHRRQRSAAIEYASVSKAPDAEYDNPELSAELDRCFEDIISTHSHDRVKGRPFTPTPDIQAMEIPADSPTAMMPGDFGGLDLSTEAPSLEGLLDDLHLPDLGEEILELDLSLDDSLVQGTGGECSNV